MATTTTKNGIVIMFDYSFFKYARICINSIEANYPEHPDLLIFYNGDDPAIISFLLKKKKVTIIKYDSDHNVSIGINTAGLNLGVTKSSQTFLKYLMWSDTFADYDKLIHLDADTVVLKPLDFMFESDEFFAVAYNFDTLINPEVASNPELIRMLEEDNIPYHDQQLKMMNAGVFMIPQRYRTAAQLELLKEITLRYDRFNRFADQGAISLWCQKNDISFNELYQYNFSGFFYTALFEAFDYSNIHIFHFAAEWKPDGYVYKTALEVSKHILSLNEKVEEYMANE
jgi:lipopolysaccharide biosynthesis glycosyltransferase